jgi:hypothetical protein
MATFASDFDARFFAARWRHQQVFPRAHCYLTVMERHLAADNSEKSTYLQCNK